MCGSSARTDLYGGRSVMTVPTVTGVTPVASVRGYSVCRFMAVSEPIGNRSFYKSDNARTARK